MICLQKCSAEDPGAVVNSLINLLRQNTMKKIIEEFENKTGYKLEVKNGKPYRSGSLDLRGTGITSLPEGLTVGGSLYLEGGTGITSLPEGLTVCGSLDLEGCTGITSLPEGLTVGDYLDLRGTGITSLHEGLAVGGSIYLRGTGITDTSNVKKLTAEQRSKIARLRNPLLIWEWNGRKYIKIDGMFSVLDSHRGNVYVTRRIGKKDQMYIVTDGEGHYAHGDTYKEAKEDLIFKINDRDTSQYEKMGLDDTLTYEEAIAAYRTITGACSAGTRNYIETRLPQPHKDKYTIREIIKLTEGEYGGDRFKKFFYEAK